MENVGESEHGVRAENAEPEPGGKIEARPVTSYRKEIRCERCAGPAERAVKF
jgi:hypothetical protein